MKLFSWIKMLQRNIYILYKAIFKEKSRQSEATSHKMTFFILK